jgi:hypothetical protein
MAVRSRLLGAVLAFLLPAHSQDWRPDVPKAWGDDAVRAMELPLIVLGRLAHHVSSEYYYRMPASRIPRTYPVYAPEREPTGYLDWLKSQDPEDALDFSKLTSKADWWRRGWDSNHVSPCRICNLQILNCRRCRKCQGCRGALLVFTR